MSATRRAGALLLVLAGIGLWQLRPTEQPRQERLHPRAAAQQSAAGPRIRPNVLIALLDDAGAGDAGALGHPLLLTPNIDRFAAGALAFSQAYAGAPNCSPSRASLLTGRSSYRTGVYDFLSRHSGDMHLAGTERTIANQLRGAGYATVHMGKWHLSRGDHGHSPWHFGFGHSNGSFVAASALLRDFAGWLRTGRASDQPFFAYLALWEPHEPVHFWSPRRFRQLYAAPPSHADGGGGVGDRRGLDSLAPSVASGGDCAWRLPKRNPARIYYGAMSQVDASFGRLLDELERLRLRRSTLLVLTSDNGPEHREPNSWGSSGGLRGAKGYVYEGGIRVPLLVQWPDAIAAPRLVHEPVHLWDLLPTVCAAAGAPVPTDRTIDGVSLLPLLLDGDAARGRSARDGDGTGEYPLDPDPRPPKRPARSRLVVPPPQAQPLPVPTPAAEAPHLGADPEPAALTRRTPLFWAMHRGRGGMQYALRVGPWKLLGGYGTSAARGGGPTDGTAEIAPWLREGASIGRVELYRLSHDPAERVDLSEARPDVVSRMLPVMLGLLRETASDGRLVAGWTQRSPPCPRLMRAINITELCCHSASSPSS